MRSGRGEGYLFLDVDEELTLLLLRAKLCVSEIDGFDEVTAHGAEVGVIGEARDKLDKGKGKKG